MLDKAKSCKSVVMQLFGSNTDIEGADTYNACYGGTSAFLNAVNWIESSSWDGRNAIVVAADIALYDKPAARPTGGAGCVAILVGPDSPLVLEPVRASYMQHTYDFYKADFKSEYPIVDGHFSSQCYLRALDGCYQRYNAKTGARIEPPSDLNTTPLDTFDYFVFHAPNCKLVAKSYGRLLYNEFLAYPSNPLFGNVPASIRNQSYETSLIDKSTEKLFMELSRENFTLRVQPSLTAPTNCGNMYTAGIYSALISLLSNKPSSELLHKRIGMFSFGSGLASTLFSLRVTGDTSTITTKINLHTRLSERTQVTPEFYNEVRNAPSCLILVCTANRTRCVCSANAHTSRKTTRPSGILLRLQAGPTT